MEETSIYILVYSLVNKSSSNQFAKQFLGNFSLGKIVAYVFGVGIFVVIACILCCCCCPFCVCAKRRKRGHGISDRPIQTENTNGAIPQRHFEPNSQYPQQRSQQIPYPTTGYDEPAQSNATNLSNHSTNQGMNINMIKF